MKQNNKEARKFLIIRDILESTATNIKSTCEGHHKTDVDTNDLPSVLHVYGQTVYFCCLESPLHANEQVVYYIILSFAREYFVSAVL